ncbi:hypothetical protein HAX54_025443 [Datura stramonium]|uniref:Uncharacterized protein n=1 Tax=Datura stramonium TaxID=4076 RepID=A0ABS8S6J7_DATST|nr:hypothetical protein [Datura stramonium]
MTALNGRCSGYSGSAPATCKRAGLLHIAHVRWVLVHAWYLQAWVPLRVGINIVDDVMAETRHSGIVWSDEKRLFRQIHKVAEHLLVRNVTQKLMCPYS